MSKIKNINLDFSKALKCSVCNVPVVSYEDLHAYGTCSNKCYQAQYYFNVTKKKRKGKLNVKNKR